MSNPIIHIPTTPESRYGSPHSSYGSESGNSGDNEFSPDLEANAKVVKQVAQIHLNPPPADIYLLAPIPQCPAPKDPFDLYSDDALLEDRHSPDAASPPAPSIGLPLRHLQVATRSFVAPKLSITSKHFAIQRSLIAFSKEAPSLRENPVTITILDEALALEL